MSIKCVTLNPMGIKKERITLGKGRFLNHGLLCGKPSPFHNPHMTRSSMLSIELYLNGANTCFINHLCYFQTMKH